MYSLKLNPFATDIFCRLLKRMYSEGGNLDRHCITIKPEGLRSLSMEDIGGGPIETPYGQGNYISLMQTYELNSDLMRDPDVTFIVVDKRNPNDNSLDLVSIYPDTFRYDSRGIYDVSWTFEGAKTTAFYLGIHLQIVSYVNNWMLVLLYAGYVH